MREDGAMLPRVTPCQLAMLRPAVATMIVPAARSNAPDQGSVRREKGRNFMSPIVSKCRACDVTPRRSKLRPERHGGRIQAAAWSGLIPSAVAEDVILIAATRPFQGRAACAPFAALRSGAAAQEIDDQQDWNRHAEQPKKDVSDLAGLHSTQTGLERLSRSLAHG